MQFVKTGVMCFKCGNNIKFVNDTGDETMFTVPDDGLGPVAAHGIKKLFAYSDTSINPKIFIHSYPDFTRVKELKGNILIIALCVVSHTLKAKH